MNIEKMGKYIAKLRKNAGLTQGELAEKIGVNSKTISKWETGVNVPDTILLYELSKVFNVSVLDILNGEKIDSQNTNNATFTDGIFFYNKIFKKKIICITIAVILFITILFSVLYTITNYNKNQLYDINAFNDNFTTRGFLITNPKESLFVIDNFSYQGADVSTNNEPKINSYSVSIQNENGTATYYSMEYNNDKYSSISDIIEKTHILFTIRKDESFLVNEEKLNQLYIIIYYDYNDETIENKIKLNFDKHYSNNKIIY